MGGQPFEDGNQSRTVGLSRREPTQHAGKSFTAGSAARTLVQQREDG